MIRATRPKPISELLGNLPAWNRRAALHGDKRSIQSAPSTLNPATLPLPAALKGKVHAQMEQHCLVLTAQTSAAAQILRFHGPRLAKAAGATETRIAVAKRSDHTANHKPRISQTRRIPANAAPLLQAVAADCDHDRLAKALRGLAKLANPDEDS